MSRTAAGGAIAVAVALYLWLVLRQLDRPFIYDEVDFAKAAQAVAAGSFVYDRGYIADYPWDAESGGRFQFALYHPPGYVLALAAWQGVAGPADRTLRAFGALCGVASLASAAGLGALAGGRSAVAWAALLWATSPYAIQSALLLDIDGTVLPPLVAAFAYCTLRPMRAPAPRATNHSALSTQRSALDFAAPAVLLAAGLWYKLTTPLAVALLLVLWSAATRRWATAGRLAAAGAAGVTLFLGTWVAFAYARGLPARQPFRDTWFEILDTLHFAPATAAGAGS